jgi:hypothetical protein
MNDSAKTVVVLVMIGVFFAGYWLGGQRHSYASNQVSAASRSETHHHGQEILDVSADIPVPTVDLIVHKDLISGYNLEIVTENFRFAPQRASAEDTPGEGHAHLYVDGEKIARVYGRWFHLENPAPGTHSLKVTLNSNSHRNLLANGRLIEEVETLIIPDHH